MRFLLLLAIGLLALPLSAQYSKGNWYLDASSNIGLADGIPGAGSLNGSRIRGGYFFAERLLVGMDLQLGELTGEGNSDHLRAVPFARYYLPSKKRRDLHYFVEAGLGFNLDRSTGLTPSAAAGAELVIAPGLVGTVTLRHTFGNNQRLASVTNLNFGLNVLLGKEHQGEHRYDLTHRKGDIMLDANFGNLSLGSFEGVSYGVGNLNVSGGYFLTDNMVVVGSAGFSASRIDWSNGGETYLYKTHSAFARLGARYQFLNGRRFQPYVSAALSYGYTKYDVDLVRGGTSLDVVRTSHTLSADLRAGFMYQLNNRLALDVGASLRPTLRQTGLDANDPGDVSIGLKVFLGKR